MQSSTGILIAVSSESGWFTVSFNPFLRVVMTPLLTGPRHCSVVVDRDEVRVTMGLGGWAFSGRIPRHALTSVRRIDGPVWAWGAHGWRGRWLVNGSSRGLVQLAIEPAARAHTLGFPVRLAQLTLSLDEPDAFVAELGSPMAPN